MSYWKTLILSLLLLAILAGCGGGESHTITIQTKGMVFVNDIFTVKAGQPVTLRVINRDGFAHAFDIDDFNIHSPWPPKRR